MMEKSKIIQHLKGKDNISLWTGKWGGQKFHGS